MAESSSKPRKSSSNPPNPKKRPHGDIDPAPGKQRHTAGNANGVKKVKQSDFPGNAMAGHAPPPIQTAVRMTGPSLPPVLTKSTVTKREEYLAKFTKWLDMEMKEDMKEVEARREKWSKQRLQREGYTIFDLKATPVGVTMNGETIIRFATAEGGNLPYHQLSTGDLVVLRAAHLNTVDANGKQISKASVEAVVIDVDNSTLVCTSSEAITKVGDLKWRIDKGTNRISYDRMIEALNRFGKAQLQHLSYNVAGIPPRYHPQTQSLEKLKKIIMDDSPKAKELAATETILQPLHTSLNFPSDFGVWRLNLSQRTTIQRCLSRTLSLIQGPPGTGKTSTVVCLIKLLTHLYRGSGITILACAYTNVATDNLLEGCLETGVSALRLGRPVKVRPELRAATLDARVEAHPSKYHLNTLREQLLQHSIGSPKYRALRDEMANLERAIIADVMKSASVICSTCIFAGDPMLRGTYFPVVVIDECTQATEPATLVPIVAGGAQQLILVGDHHQLPPTVKSDTASKEGFTESLFSRLIHQAKLDVFMLNTQYRMHPRIAEFPAKHFYHGKLLNGVTAEERPKLPGFDWPLNLPVAFLNMPGSGEKRGENEDSRSWQNPVEANQVCDIVKVLLGTHQVHPKSIGIVTPYSAQVRLIHNLLRQELHGYQYMGEDVADDDNMIDYRGHDFLGITISSVDSFQGREKDVILFSAVRSNKRNTVGFLSDWRRLNVALTRAKRGIIVVGDRDLLVSDEHWKAWIEWIEGLGGMRTLAPQQAEPPAKDEASAPLFAAFDETVASTSSSTPAVIDLSDV